ncbi:MAG: translation initiation factor IF-2 [Bacteroidales bacterium]|jgi:translation initiation factor IF-2|nr:translation initiation factor IF-2 [Bacteroidales bacterium]
MAEEKQQVYRLQKVAKEFNVSITTIADYLRKKGHTIDINPNARIEQEDYDLIATQFKTDSQLKLEADKAKLIVERPVKEKENPKEEKEQPKQQEVQVKEELQEEAADIEQEQYPPKSIKEKPAKKSDPIEEEKSEQSEIKQHSNKSKTKEDTKQSTVNEPIVLGKIDLASLMDNKPNKKKTKEEREKERIDIRRQEREVSEQLIRQKSQERQKEAQKQETQQPQEEDKPKEFIKTQYVKLTGPIVVGEKIDLNTLAEKPRTPFNKDKNAAGKKEKRKRQKITTKVDINKPFAPSNETKADKKRPQSDFNKSKNNKKKPEHKEIDSNEIERLVKENLARLSTAGGKSKTSKHKREKRKEIQQHLQEEIQAEMQSKNILKVTEFVTANELATMMAIDVTKVISACMTLGIFVSINQRIDAETIQLIADEFGFKVEFVDADVAEALADEEKDNPEDLVARAPIVTVMGHVDHGKTSLLDYIRNAHVIAVEAGGITQHIGAYEVTLPKSGKKITFLDTPGHEAFTAMRARGAKVTDIAIIVVACDDKIMPQTIEAINHAQAAGVPIVFALNKIDKPGADPDRIKTELANMNLLVEEWGGKYQSQEISAKKGTNVDLLLEKVLLEAEILDLKGNPNKRAKGTIIESSLDKGRGYVAKILVEDGTISQGDMVLAGSTYGKVKAMYNEHNQTVKSAGPSTPVLLLGLNGAPQAGDTFNVMENDKEAKDLATRRTQLQREQGLRTQKHITLDEIGRRIAIGDFKELNLIVKGDVDGSVEALSDSLLKLSTEEVMVNVIHKSIGQITESDVLLATASNAIIIGFQVRPSVAARKLAEQEQVDIRLYSVIYNAINELSDAIKGMLAPEIQEKIVANLEIRDTFKISKVGTIAGCICIDGKINRNTKVRIIRDGIVVYSGKLASLKRFKDDVKEVVMGQDCGLNIDGFNDIKVGDIVEGYEEIEVARK